MIARAWTRLVRALCGALLGHDPRVRQVDLLWKRGAWCKVCRRCGVLIEVL